MKRKNIITTLALTLALGVGATAYAATASPRNINTSNINNDNTSYSRRMDGRTGIDDYNMMDMYDHHMRGMGNHHMMGFGGYDMMTSILRDKLNMSDKEIEDALNSGKHMWEIAEEKGMSNEDFKNAMVEGRTKAIDEAIKNGTITKEEGERFKEDFDNYIDDCLDESPGSENGFHGMMGRGRGGRSCH
ncbi:hypothetical protein KQI86_04580 [Clostridium sp. MSJ-11]|uniref:Uncharacterized protein n=1 Tax=Clostridium mobile TaxID=2841512 RepID=A0ABS6EGQ0_9CLOT|nr:hypothetical protein [Clostridium mobile]MBU5483594.1 hypothetical protein [Clostridium mobile]